MHTCISLSLVKLHLNVSKPTRLHFDRHHVFVSIDINISWCSALLYYLLAPRYLVLASVYTSLHYILNFCRLTMMPNFVSHVHGGSLHSVSLLCDTIARADPSMIDVFLVFM